MIPRAYPIVQRRGQAEAGAFVVCPRCGMSSTASPVVCSHCGALKVDPHRVQPSPAPGDDSATKSWVRREVGWVLFLVFCAPVLIKGCGDLADREGRAKREQEERDRRALGGG
jgi:hypothetical protein